MVKKSKTILWLEELRAPFCTASSLPVLIGSALAFSNTGHINTTLCILAVCATVAIHLGANIANDYFDHLSGNDAHNDNKTPFSGGSRMIQKKLLSPNEILTGSVIFFVIGAILGIAILVITKSFFVLAFGLIGILGGFFYTAPPLKLGYRTAGEITIAFLFGILPVYGSYYIQTLNFNLLPLIPSMIAAVLIFLVIFANEFPDFSADSAVNKKNLVVTFGINNAAKLYKAALAILAALAIIYSFISRNVIASAILLIPIISASTICLKNADAKKLAQKGIFDLSKTTILLHFIGCTALIAAILFSKPI